MSSLAIKTDGINIVFGNSNVKTNGNDIVYGNSSNI